MVRGALPQFQDLLEVADLTALASRDDVESRTVVRRGRARETSHGPFARLHDAAPATGRCWVSE